MATTYTFTLVPTWGAVGSLVRRGTGGTHVGTVTDPGGASVTVVQGGVTQAGYLLPDPSGVINFTTTDVPTVLVDFGAGPVTANATNAVTANLTAAANAASSAASAQSAADSATASAALVGAPAGSAIDAYIGSGASVAVRKGAGFADIRDYGAKTSLTDNRAAIQSAMDAMAAAGGGVVYVPTGVWNVKALAKTFTTRSGVTIRGESRTGSVLRVHESSGDWGYLFVYDNAAPSTAFAITNLTLDGSTATGYTTTVQGSFASERTLTNIVGTGCSVTSCDIKANGVWAVRVVGSRCIVADNTITYDVSSYTFGDFDQSIIWAAGQWNQIEDNRISIAPASGWSVHTAIEFQGHRNRVANNRTTSGRSRTGVIFTANTFSADSYYTIPNKGALGNVIEGNDLEAIQYGVDIWGMVITSPVAMQQNTIRRNRFSLDATGTSYSMAGINAHIGTAGAGGNNDIQTSPVDGLEITDNLITLASRRVSTANTTADAGIRLYTQVNYANVLISRNRIVGSGGWGVILYGDGSTTVNGVDVMSNVFRECRVPVKLFSGVNQFTVKGNVFRQDSTYATGTDNMLATIEGSMDAFTSLTGGAITGNEVLTPATLKPLYPRFNQTGSAFFPASRGYRLEQSDTVLQQANGRTVAFGQDDVVRRTSDGAAVKSQFGSGATYGTLKAADGTTNVTITAVTDAQTMTVSDATNLRPQQVVALPFNAPFASGSAVVRAVVGNTVYTGTNNLAAASGHTWSEAVGAVLSYYTAVTVL